MKKLIFAFTFLLAACSSSITPNAIAGKMPHNGNRNLIYIINATSNPISDGILVASLKIDGGEMFARLENTLAIDNLNVGISGKSQMINKAMVLRALERSTFGKNTKIFMLGDSESDKLELETAAKKREIPFEYFLIAK